ncbi:MAG: type III-B CRISPR module RAMP protein Cmr6 [Akkermansiaceae bacterium]|nr:type III-B CRISPR module RAMP protein Cmr6 [Akkermansiaceae bacterium]
MLDTLRRRPAGGKLARSLAATRYVDFPDDAQDKDWRRRNASAVKDGATDSRKLGSWRDFALKLAGADRENSPHLLLARQKSRLMVNMAGGVFENGNLCLDRVSGIPFLPGSAVKGCTRRLALAALQEWISGELIPGDGENLLSAAVADFKSPEDFLFQLCLIFGWGDLEWHDSKDKSDFAWACGEQWNSFRFGVVGKLCAHLRIEPKDKERPWKSLPHFAGSVAFLPAYPWEKDPGIELDVITCHHSEYYKGNDAFADAPDTEEPVPVIFPAIAPGGTWAFLLQPTARTQDHQIETARAWLALGLEALGIGAKTNAGYGWFDASQVVNEQAWESLAVAEKREKEAAAREAGRINHEAELEKRRRAREAEAAATKGMSEDERADWKLAQLSDDQLSSKVHAFFKEPKKGGPSAEESKAIVRALRGSKLDFWNQFKTSAVKGDPARAADAIRALNKQLFGDKMP